MGKNVPKLKNIEVTIQGDDGHRSKTEEHLLKNCAAPVPPENKWPVYIMQKRPIHSYFFSKHLHVIAAGSAANDKQQPFLDT